MTDLNLKATHGNSITGVATGFPKLDEMTSGFQGSELILLAGRPSVGKSAFLFQFIHHAACTLGKNIGLFSIEMPKYQVADRIICQAADINLLEWRKGSKNSTYWNRAEFVKENLKNCKILIEDESAITLTKLRGIARGMSIKDQIDIICIDYLQLIQASGKRTEEEAIAEIAKSLKSLARELKIPVIACTQLSRALEKRDTKRPVLSDLRGSGMLEQAADLVIFLHSIEQRNDDQADGINYPIELIIAKQRNGPKGSINLNFYSHSGLFSEYNGDVSKFNPKSHGETRGEAVPYTNQKLQI